jgi:type IV fimbrial biogenesis protein FimT
MSSHPSFASTTKPFRGGAQRFREHGFTLIELVVTIAIAAILTGLAASPMTKMFAANRVQTEASSFVSDLMLARAEAVKRGQGVSLCPSSNGTTCLGTNTWNSGWIIYPDSTQCNPAPTASTTIAAPIRVRAPFKGSDTLVATAPATNTCVSFNREGFASSGGGVVFTLHASPSTTQSTRCVSVGLGGRVSTLTTADSTCL